MIKKVDDQKGDLVVYQSQDGDISFNVNVFEETVFVYPKADGGVV